MLETPVITQTAARKTAAIHVVVARSEIQKVMGPGLSELLSTLRAQGVTPAGPWFTHHLRMSPDVFEFELGVPVDAPITPAGRVTNSELPAATVARAVYRGPYEGLSQAWGEFMAWIAAQGRTAGPSLWETYLADPSTSPDPSTWRTELTRPLVDQPRP